MSYAGKLCQIVFHRVKTMSTNLFHGFEDCYISVEYPRSLQVLYCNSSHIHAHIFNI